MSLISIWGRGIPLTAYSRTNPSLQEPPFGFFRVLNFKKTFEIGLDEIRYLRNPEEVIKLFGT
jgi:hypothetical protein